MLFKNNSVGSRSETHISMRAAHKACSPEESSLSGSQAQISRHAAPLPRVTLVGRTERFSEEELDRAAQIARSKFSNAGIACIFDASNRFPDVSGLDACLVIAQERAIAYMPSHFGVEDRPRMAGGPTRVGPRISRNDYQVLKERMGIPYDPQTAHAHVGVVSIPGQLSSIRQEQSVMYLGLVAAHEAAHCWGGELLRAQRSDEPHSRSARGARLRFQRRRRAAHETVHQRSRRQDDCGTYRVARTVHAPVFRCAHVPRR